MRVSLKSSPYGDTKGKVSTSVPRSPSNSLSKFSVSITHILSRKFVSRRIGISSES